MITGVLTSLWSLVHMRNKLIVLSIIWNNLKWQYGENYKVEKVLNRSHSIKNTVVVNIPSKNSVNISQVANKKMFVYPRWLNLLMLNQYNNTDYIEEIIKY